MKMSQFLDNYVVGEGNRLAHAVLVSLLENPPETAYNPVIIGGRPGVGKTYSIRKVAEAFQKLGRNVYLTTCMDLISELTEDIHCGMNERYMEKCLSADVVLIENLEVLDDLRSTQLKLAHLADEIIASGKLLIMTISVSENDFPDWLNFYERYPWRLFSYIDVPDFDMKQKALQKLINSTKIDIPAEVVDYLAEHCCDFRRLEGYFKSLVARKNLLDEEITIKLAHIVMNDMENF